MSSSSSSSSSTYGQKPLYYGTSKKSPLYYGSSQTPMYYGSSQTPMYYGSAQSPMYYGGGGQTPYYYGGAYGGQSAGQDADSIVGSITAGRVLRVITQRWISVLVFFLIGLVAAFAVYRISPTIYEAKSEFTMDTRRHTGNNSIIGNDMEFYGNNYAEIFNTRLSGWRSEAIFTKILQQYRANFPNSTTTDKDLVEMLGESELELLRNSRLITIAVRSRVPELAAALANAYAEAIESYTDEENKKSCDKAVSQIHQQVEKQKRVDDDLAARLLKFRTEHKIDNMMAERDILNQSLSATTVNVLEYEKRVTAMEEWVKVLQAAQKNPENFGELPSEVPRSSDIGTAYTKLQNVKMELATLKTSYTPQHPAVVAKEGELKAITHEFGETVKRAYATAVGNLTASRNQLQKFRKDSDELNKKLSKIGLQIVQADAGLKQLEQEKRVSSELYQNLLQKENEGRIAAEQDNEKIRLGRPAQVPSKPVLPNPLIIFTAGAVISLGLGLLFVLVLDHLEDTIVSLSDIEGRLALKVLAVLPHVRRKKREQVAKFISENKYSQFAESMAGLRNLLDSPRYQPISQAVLLMSTQPGEGKTITSCSLAISSAQAGKKTLLVDFDMRRPRLARVWGLQIDNEHSFSHYLSRGDQRDFASLVMPSGVESLDVIGSLPPDNVNPASIMGSQVVPDFFKWARENYDRIVVDSPPFGIVGDVMTLASMVDSVMIMGCPDRTHFKPIQHAARSLGEAGATVIGIVVNDVEMGGAGSAFAPAGHSYGYGYGGYGGYRSYGRGYRPYAPYGPIATAKTKGGADGSPAAEGKGNDSVPAGEEAHASSGAVSSELTDEE